MIERNSSFLSPQVSSHSGGIKRRRKSKWIKFIHYSFNLIDF